MNTVQNSEASASEFLEIIVKTISKPYGITCKIFLYTYNYTGVYIYISDDVYMAMYIIYIMCIRKFTTLIIWLINIIFYIQGTL